MTEILFGTASPIRVKRVDAIPLKLPLKKPMQMASVRVEHAETVLVRVEAENGLVGWGEASSAPTMTGDTLQSLVAAVHLHLAPLVVGSDAMDRGLLAGRLQHAMHHNGGAKAAVEMALNDLVGRHLGVSVTDLFGGAVRDSVEPMYLLGNPSREEDVTEAIEKTAVDFSFIKLKCGVKSVEYDIETAIAVRKAVGAKVRLCADANMGMNLRSAARYAAGVADLGVEFLEQPLGADDLSGMTALARVSPVPLAGDECIGSLSDILVYHRAGALAGVNLKTIKCGGIAATHRVSTVCDSLGLSIKLACKVAESSVGAAALVHLGYTIGNLDWGISISNIYLAEDVVHTPLLPVGRTINRPTGPGLGIEIDEAAVERWRVP